MNNPICTASHKQQGPVICSDAHGGAIITWWDTRTDAGDIYAQRIDSLGYIRWRTDGVAICVAQNQQAYPRIIGDGQGGAIIVWDDQRTGTYSGNIYAQRIDGDGNVRWTANGTLIHNPVSYTPAITSDGAGGAIIVWRDDRAGSVDVADIYAERIDSSGTSQWSPSTGVPICASSDQQLNPIAVSDDSGGAIIAWTDTRPTGIPNVYAQRINSWGQVRWTTNGIPIAALSTTSTSPAMIPDGYSGVYIIWRDDRSPTYNSQIYGQHVNARGVIQWVANGRPLTAESQNITGYDLAPDVSGGFLISFEMYESYSDMGIHAQRINSSGNVLWDTSGISLCSSRWDRHNPKMIPDGSAGAIVTWYDDRDLDTTNYMPRYDIYAQRVDSAGLAQWTVNGMPICTASNGQLVPRIISAKSGGAIIAWQDNRVGDQNNTIDDIYAQRINVDGTITGIREIHREPGSFKLEQNYPNPFNPTTTLKYSLPTDSRIKLTIYTVLGQDVQTLVDGVESAGYMSIEWNASGVASGIYFYRLYAKGVSAYGGEATSTSEPTKSFMEVKKMLLLK